MLGICYIACRATCCMGRGLKPRRLAGLFEYKYTSAPMEKASMKIIPE
uniref:Uncharacterized protein n=1 Tax=Arundo donax TaxID=35708 RepID=A0A0A9GT07_ARUDO